MLWKESMREGARLESFAAGLGAARRRGFWAAGVAILNGCEEDRSGTIL